PFPENYRISSPTQRECPLTPQGEKAEPISLGGRTQQSYVTPSQAPLSVRPPELLYMPASSTARLLPATHRPSDNRGAAPRRRSLSRGRPIATTGPYRKR